MKKIIGPILLTLFLLLLSIMTFGPLAWTLVSSLKSQGEMLIKPWALPEKLVFKNYADTWRVGKFASLFSNSAIVTAEALVVMIFCGALASFSLSRHKTKFNRPIMLYFLVGQTISAAMIIFPLALLQFHLNLRGTYEGLSLVYVAGGLPFTVFVLYSFFDKVPAELYDAARIDGCGEFKCFFHIAVPMVKAGVATIGLFQFMWVWNEFTIALTLISNAEMRTLPVGLYTVVQGVLATNYVMAFAGTMIVSIPIIIIYLVFQKHLIRGLAEGAIKI